MLAWVVWRVMYGTWRMEAKYVGSLVAVWLAGFVLDTALRLSDRLDVALASTLLMLVVAGVVWNAQGATRASALAHAAKVAAEKAAKAEEAAKAAGGE